MMTGLDDFERHPCFSEKAARQCGRIHLPVASGCNIKCVYCQPASLCRNENRPGAASRVLTVAQALALLQKALSVHPYIRVVGIAGVGEPLHSRETFCLLQAVKEQFPELELCLSTNGLLLPQKVSLLHQIGVRYITITINAVDPQIAARAVEWITDENHQVHRGTDAGTMLIASQMEGLKAAVQYGMNVKVNSVLIPGVNETHLSQVALVVKSYGAKLMNVISVYPWDNHSGISAPSESLLSQVRKSCESHVALMRHCRRCRADALGLLNSKTTLEDLAGREDEKAMNVQQA